MNSLFFAAREAIEAAIDSFGKIRLPEYDGTPQTWCDENKRVLNERTELIVRAVAPFFPANAPQDTTAKGEDELTEAINRAVKAERRVASLEAAFARALEGFEEWDKREGATKILAEADCWAYEKHARLMGWTAARLSAPVAPQDWMREAAKEIADTVANEGNTSVVALLAIIARHAPASTEDSQLLDFIENLPLGNIYIRKVEGMTETTMYGWRTDRFRELVRAAMVRTPKESNE